MFDLFVVLQVVFFLHKLEPTFISDFPKNEPMLPRKAVSKESRKCFLGVRVLVSGNER